MEFAQPLHLLLLLVVALIGVRLVFFFFWRRKARRAFSGGQARKWQDSSFLLRAGLVCAGLALVVVAAARPQWGVTEIQERLEGTDIVIVLDISPSMYAEDAGTSRLRRAQEAGALLAESLVGNRIGFVVYSQSAFIRSPLSTDVGAVAELIRHSERDMRLVRPGTDLPLAFEAAAETLEHSDNAAQAVVLIGDGEGHTPGAIEAVTALADAGIAVWTVGVGSTEGATIPVQGAPPGTVMLHADGSEIVTYLEEQRMREMAAAGGGSYVSINNSASAVLGVQNEIQQMAGMFLGERTNQIKAERFGVFLLAGVLVLLLEWVMQTSGMRLRLPLPRGSASPVRMRSRA